MFLPDTIQFLAQLSLKKPKEEPVISLYLGQTRRIKAQVVIDIGTHNFDIHFNGFPVILSPSLDSDYAAIDTLAFSLRINTFLQVHVAAAAFVHLVINP